ncbi:hypothetical protein T190_31885 [Sinorhizobium meliloti CCBAU 01290]|nr:hypothetical protein T190_31885 [Sinorhizobium meliloti CCBAU 01290]
MKFDAADLCDGDETFDAIDLQVRLLVAEDLDELEEVPRSRLACRWKNCSPPMPSGARMIEHHRPFTWSMEPTAS